MSDLLNATITEGIVLIFVAFIVTMLYIRYANRKKTAALLLAVGFSFWLVAIICLFTFRLMSYLVEIGKFVEYFSYSDLGINLGYAFSAISNVFIMFFVSYVFAQSPMFRRTGMFIPFNFAAFNGATIGLLIGSTLRNWPTPDYALGSTAYHLIMTFIAFSTLIIFAIRPLRRATYRWEKAGFAFIICSGVTGILIYLSFTLDVMLPEFTSIEGGYTPFFYLAYVFGILMVIFAYLGYVMPNFVRNWFKEKPAKELAE
jgi:ABC-type cobalamin transport system permease subunit